MSVKVRFAPSPTGYLHAGNVRTAVVTWLFTRNMDGKFLLRIDDTDVERSKPEYEDDIENSLTWLGLDWDEKARQRDRGDRYQECIETLKKEGRLYACYETPEELSLKRKALLSRSLPPIYDRSALSLTDEQKAEFEAKGRKPHWRFKLNHAPIEWNDMVRGEVKFSGSDLSDPVLIREDGTPLYHICSVIDDIDYEITHVIRGEDHVSNTASHIQMFEALGHKAPLFAHLPMISDKEGGKLSKRLGSMSARDFRYEEKIEPMALISLLARLGSAESIVPFTNLDELVKEFDISKFSKGAPKFDMEELLRLNQKIMHETPFATVQKRLEEMNLTALDEDFWNGVRANLTRLDDIQEWWDVAKGPVTPQIEDSDYIETALANMPPEPWSENTWKEWTDTLKETTGRKGKMLFMPLREALTGMSHGPELSDLLPLIGFEKAKERLSQNRKAA
jgi:glutamyl-tRNA synthetase